MRPLTPFVSYFDNAGRLLVGRVRFCNLDSSPAEVFADDAGTTTLGSTVYTNAVGRMDVQPFLEDHDYILYFDQYIGDGTMAEDDDPESWEEQGSAVNKYDTLGIKVESDFTMCVGTVAELRRTDPRTAGDYMTVNLLGYHSAGDKPEIAYYWDGRNTDADNGGSVIKVSGIETGRWVIRNCPRYFDTRHFGAFPMQTAQENAEQRYAIQLADEFSHVNGCFLYFSSDESSAYYDVTGLDLYDVDASEGARIFSAGQWASVTGIERIRCGGAGMTGTISLVSRTVRTSYGGDEEDYYDFVKFLPTEELVVDEPLRNSTNEGYREWSGIRVTLLVNPGQCEFDNCEIVSNGKITGSLTVKNCELKSEWFDDGYNWNLLSSVGNRLLLRNFDTAQTYVTLKNRQGEYDYGDLGEQTISDMTIGTDDASKHCIAENAYFSNVTIAGNSELHNVTGTVTLATGFDHNWLDCWITISSNSISNAFAVTRGVVSGAGAGQNESVVRLGVRTSLVASDCSFRNITIVNNGYSTFNDVDVEQSCKQNRLEARNSRFRSRIVCNELDAEHCSFHGNIEVNVIDSLRVKFIENVVHPESKMYIARDDSSYAVNIVADNCKWTNNTVMGLAGRAERWLDIDRTYFDSVDEHHSYEYEGNVPEKFQERLLDHVTLGAEYNGTTLEQGFLRLCYERERAMDSYVFSSYYMRFVILRGLLKLPNTFAMGTNTFGKCRAEIALYANNYSYVATFILDYRKSDGEIVMESNPSSYLLDMNICLENCVRNDRDYELNEWPRMTILEPLNVFWTSKQHDDARWVMKVNHDLPNNATKRITFRPCD